jgi:multicomponent K+:H+ antiporter subunit D
MTDWIIAPVLLPAILAALLVFLRNHQALQRVVSVIGVSALLAIAVTLMQSATVSAPEAYFLGDWPAPFGIVLVLDRLSAMMVLVTAILALGVLIYAIGSGWDAKGAHFHPLYQFQLMGLSGAFLTGDAFNLFVFFEVLLIASYGLMLHGGGRDRMRAGIQYVAFNLVGSTLFLFALATIYSVTGTLNMADLAVRLLDLPTGDVALIRVAAVLLLMVFAIKGALVPLQFWLPGAYANAPGVVAALFAVMTKVGAYAMIRFGTLVFPPDLAATGTLYGQVLLPAALVTLGIGAIGVLGATTLPRLAAFAAIASMGTVFIGIAGFTPASISAALYYIVHSTLAGAVLFLVADLVVARRDHGRLDVATGPVAQTGLLGALFMIAASAVAGMPPLSGFVGKLLILQAWREAAPVIWSAILVTSFLVIVGCARAGSTLFWKSHEVAVPARPYPAEPLAIVAVGGLIGVLIGLIVFAGPITTWLDDTAAQLFAPTGYVQSNQLYKER